MTDVGAVRLHPTEATEPVMEQRVCAEWVLTPIRKQVASSVAGEPAGWPRARDQTHPRATDDRPLINANAQGLGNYAGASHRYRRDMRAREAACGGAYAALVSCPWACWPTLPPWGDAECPFEPVGGKVWRLLKHHFPTSPRG